MTPADAVILLLEDFKGLTPLAQLGTATSCIGALGGSIFWAWRGRKYVAALVETNAVLELLLQPGRGR